MQAARVFVVDMLMSAQGGSVRVLPCLAAALDAWPEALPSLAGAATEPGASDDHVRVLHAVLQQMCADAAAVGRCAVSWSLVFTCCTSLAVGNTQLEPRNRVAAWDCWSAGNLAYRQPKHRGVMAARC